MNMSDTRDIKILYLVGGPLTSRWLDYYCLDELYNKGYNLEFWNCAEILPDGGYSVSQTLKRPFVKNISNYKQFKSELCRLPRNTIFISEIAFLPSTKKYTKLVSKYLKYCVDINIWSSITKVLVDAIDEEKFYNTDISQVANKTIKQWLYQFDFIKIVHKLIKYGFSQTFYDYIHQLRLNKDLNRVNKYERRFKKIHVSYLPQDKYRILHPDFTKYLAIRNNEPILNEPYIVFIGQYFPYHPDFSLDRESGEFNETAKNYYESLNSFFDQIEKQYNCKIVIAEHPSGYHIHNPYNGRKIVYFKTAELIKDAEAVCMHNSNSINFVALFDKPVAIISCKALHNVPSMFNFTSFFASVIKSPIIEIDNLVDFNRVFQHIDKTLRDLMLEILEDNEHSNLSNADLYAKYFNDIYNRIKSSNHA